MRDNYSPSEWAMIVPELHSVVHRLCRHIPHPNPICMESWRVEENSYPQPNRRRKTLRPQKAAVPYCNRDENSGTPPTKRQNSNSTPTNRKQTGTRQLSPQPNLLVVVVYRGFSATTTIEKTPNNQPNNP